MTWSHIHRSPRGSRLRSTDDRARHQCISELMRSHPDAAVTAWVARQPRGTLYTTGVNEAGISYGISAIPEGRRRSGFTAGAEALFAEEFAGRVLPFGGAAARRYAEIVVLKARSDPDSDQPKLLVVVLPTDGWITEQLPCSVITDAAVGAHTAVDTALAGGP